jgi:hypothetical protein
MPYEHRPQHFDIDLPLVHGTFEPMRVEIVQVPTAELPYEEMVGHGWLGLIDPHATVIGTLIDAHETVGQAGAGIDGGYQPGGGAIRAEWWAQIPDDGPPRLRFYASSKATAMGSSSSTATQSATTSPSPSSLAADAF